MSLINVTNVIIKEATAPFTDPITVEINFDALHELNNPLVWKIIYIGEAKNEGNDQVLEEVPVPIQQVGPMRIMIESSGPDPSIIPPEEFIGVTAILVTCSYNDNEFFRVGYYVNVLYADEEMNENPPNPPLIDQLGRIIMVDQPRVTNFPIEWDSIGSTLGVVPPELLENYNPTTGFGYTTEGKQQMYAQDRKEMFSSENVMNAAETLKSQFANLTNQ